MRKLHNYSDVTDSEWLGVEGHWRKDSHTASHDAGGHPRLSIVFENLGQTSMHSAVLVILPRITEAVDM